MLPYCILLFLSPRSLCLTCTNIIVLCFQGLEFPANFKTLVTDIFRRLFRVYAHIYATHFSVIVSLGEEAHLNTSFKHFILFVKEFDLIDPKELAPLSDLIESLILQTKN